ncbi:YdhR family protein [Halocynthiibacter styelae]|uniref:YdhR family protein n=1 Tax=Halocynthiibacter styelae TaxID=2761955 RepID=A0A8J7IP00_9RHOB|nr:YdhR family protein [Paenihalocynthiibacter styelae]MBI1494386.1 YdhR family protein [Paenihalocynthiibacter styelae]
MLFTQVRFNLDTPISLVEATAIFESTAPKYKGHPGLLLKHYFRSEDGKTVGGLYFWESREAAEATYAGPWREMVEKKYGAEPQIEFFESPVHVDNRTPGA